MQQTGPTAPNKATLLAKRLRSSLLTLLIIWSFIGILSLFTLAIPLFILSILSILTIIIGWHGANRLKPGFLNAYSIITVLLIVLPILLFIGCSIWVSVHSYHTQNDYYPNTSSGSGYYATRKGHVAQYPVGSPETTKHQTVHQNLMNKQQPHHFPGVNHLNEVAAPVRARTGTTFHKPVPPQDPTARNMEAFGVKGGHHKNVAASSSAAPTTHSSSYEAWSQGVVLSVLLFCGAMALVALFVYFIITFFQIYSILLARRLVAEIANTPTLPLVTVPGGMAPGMTFQLVPISTNAQGFPTAFAAVPAPTSAQQTTATVTPAAPAPAASAPAAPEQPKESESGMYFFPVPQNVAPASKKAAYQYYPMLPSDQ